MCFANLPMSPLARFQGIYIFIYSENGCGKRLRNSSVPGIDPRTMRFISMRNVLCVIRVDHFLFAYLAQIGLESIRLPSHTDTFLPGHIGQTGEETYFKIKTSTRMQKVFHTYATRKGLLESSLRFLLDGDRIKPDDTPKTLELDDQDQIDCMLEQSGGYCRNEALFFELS